MISSLEVSAVQHNNASTIMLHFKLNQLCLALPVLYVLCSQAMAQQASTTLPTLIIVASPEVGQPDELGPQRLKTLRSATSDTARLLTDIPGVSLYGAGGVSSLPAVHGLADDRLRIQVDGMDLIASCPNHMNPALSYIDPTNVGALRVYAGITPVSAGGDAIGGTIAVESLAPLFAAPGQSPLAQGETGTFYRSNNRASGANVSATYATQTFNISYRASISQADNTVAGGDFKNYEFSGRAGHTLARNELGSTAFETRNHQLGVAFRSDKHLLEARLGYQDMPFQLYPNQRMDLLGNTGKSLNVRYMGDFDWGLLRVQAYHDTVNHVMDFGTDKRFWYGGSTVAGVVSGSGGSTSTVGVACSPAGTAICAAGMPMITQGKTTGLSVKAEVQLNPQDLLRVGSELQQYRNNDYWTPSGGGMMPGTFWNVQDGQRDRTAVFAEWEASRSAQWMTLVGARVEQVKMDAGQARGYSTTAAAMGFQVRDASAFNAGSHASTDNNLDLTALARYTASPAYGIEFGYAHKVRSPNVYERFTWSTWQMAALMNNFVGDGNAYVGNLALKPEKADTLSATFDWHDGDRHWGVKATPYFTQVTDFIDAQQWNATANAPVATRVTDKFSVLRYVNQSARLYGLDLSGHMPLGSNGLGEFGLKGLLSYTRGSNRDTGDGLYNIMPFNARLTVTQQAGAWANSLELLMVSSKDTVSAVRNEIKTPGYSLVSARASYSWKQVRLDFGVENLLDKLYYLPTGGAYTGQGTTMTNSALPNYPQYGTAVPGMGRSIYVGVNVKF